MYVAPSAFVCALSGVAMHVCTVCPVPYSKVMYHLLNSIQRESYVMFIIGHVNAGLYWTCRKEATSKKS